MEEQPTVIKVDAVSKSFKLPHEKQTSLKGSFVNMFRGKRTFERQHVLKNISFEVKKGEFFGIVGRNGSGKSTLLKLLAGIYAIDKGNLQVDGSLTPFIELGVGFNPELTGRENVYLNGALLGFNRKDMEEMYDDIVEFAELKKFMDQKLKNYSSGMQVRLAFSIAIRARSDILLIDEVLAVGDAIFQHKCFAYFKELKKRKQTVIFISHDSTILQEYCDRGILLERGKIVSEGNITEVVQDYTDILNKHEAALDEAEVAKTNSEDKSRKKRWGRGDVLVIDGQAYVAKDKKPRHLFTEADDTIGIRIEYEAKTAADKPIYGITIQDASGQRIFESNTLWSRIATASVQPGQRIVIEWDVPNIFNTGDFTVVPAVADEFGAIIFDWRENFMKFKVRKKIRSSAYANVDHRISVISDSKSIK